MPAQPRATARTKARRRALEILFEAEARDVPALPLLEERVAAGLRRPGPGEQQPPSVSAYAQDLVRGVVAHRDEIDDLIGGYAQGWTLDRMPAVDRNLLRIGVWELRWNEEVPDPVAISEAVLLATELSTDESPAFINGLLSRLSATGLG